MDKYAELRAAVEQKCSAILIEDVDVIRALLAERDELREAVEALLARPSGMYCDGYPEAERKARAALAQQEQS